MTNQNLPTANVLHYSREFCYDSFYKLPREVENFIDHARNEFPSIKWSIKVWSINQAVTLFFSNIPVLIITYEDIFGDIIYCLDMVKNFPLKSLGLTENNG